MLSKYFSRDFCVSSSIRFIMPTEFWSVSPWMMVKLTAKTSRMLVRIAATVMAVICVRIECMSFPLSPGKPASPCDEIPVHASQPAMLISRYMFLTEPFQEAQMPSSRSLVT